MTEMAVAIINYNTRAQLANCLATVCAAGACEVVVVDNGSTDGSVEMTRERYPAVRVITRADNPGYGAASNLAVAACAAPYVLLLNSDTLLPPNALVALSAYLDQMPRAGLAGPRLANPDGSLQPSCFPFPTPPHVAIEQSGLVRLLGRAPVLRQQYLRTWSHGRSRAVPWVLGAALALRRSAFEAVGGFDEAFFMYAEEIDLCHRLWSANWEVHFTPVTTLTHIGGASTARYRAAMRAQWLRGLRQFYHRHYSSRSLVALRLVMSLILGGRLARDLTRRALAADPARRTDLTEDLRAWRLMALGWREHVEATVTHAGD